MTLRPPGSCSVSARAAASRSPGPRFGPGFASGWAPPTLAVSSAPTDPLVQPASGVGPKP